MNSNDTTELEPGTELELTYDGSHGSRTVTVYVVAHETSENILDEDKTDHELVAAEPGARRSRFVRVAISGTETEDLLDADEWGVVKSLNSKSSRGRRLGRLESLTATGETAEEYQAVRDLRDVAEGEVVEADGSEYVVITTSTRRALVEPRGGDLDERVSFYAHASGVHESGESEVVTFERLGETYEDEQAAEVYEAARSFGHGDRRKAEAVEVEGERFEIVYRNDPLKIASADADEGDYDAVLTHDALGLTLVGRYGSNVEDRRVDADDVTLVYEDEDDESDDEGEQVETDGGEDEDDAPAFEVGEQVEDGDDDEPGTMRVLDPDAGAANEVEVGTTGRTVSEFEGNEDYADDDRVVTCVFESALDSNAPGWDEADDLPAWLDDYAAEWGVNVRTYDYPESRLTRHESDDESDTSEDPDADEDDEQGDESGDTVRHVEDLRESEVETYDAPDGLEPAADDEDEPEAETDGGMARGREGFMALPSTDAVVLYVHPFPSFDEFDEATATTYDLVREQVEREVEAARERDEAAREVRA